MTRPDVPPCQVCPLRPKSRPRRTPSWRNGYPHRCRGWVGKQVPQIRRASVAQDCCFPACEECRLLDCERRRNLVSDQINASVNLVEASALEPELDLSRRDACL